MKKKPTLEDEARKLRLILLGRYVDCDEWSEDDFRSAFMRLARHVRRREKKAMNIGTKIIRILTK